MKLHTWALTRFGFLLAAFVGGAALAAPQVTFAPGDTMADGGLLHVLAQDPAATALTPDQVGTYQVSILVVPEPGAVGNLVLTASQGTTPFFSGPGQGPLASYVPDADNGNIYYSASDSPLAGGTADLTATPVGLFDLSYVGTPGAQGTFDLKFFTSSSDPLGSYLGGAFDISSFSNPPIPGTEFMDGSVTITPSPEPASVFGLALAGAAVLVRRPRRRTR